jgi:thioredoxin-dependent peroxiredoxin
MRIPLKDDKSCWYKTSNYARMFRVITMDTLDRSEFHMLKSGDIAPDFELYNQDNKLVRLSDYRGQKVIVFTFPRAGTSDCTRQASIYRDNYHCFVGRNTVVLGISSNTTDILRIWREKNHFPFDLLSDTSHAVLKQLGVWGQDVIGFIQIPAAKRSYWLIDEDGIIQAMKIGIKPDEAIDDALAFIEQNTLQREI